ncbi:MAG TPA: hypothetical protein VNT60_01985 [Deinococcales bacterium]|nr:hypothetical protein [Deinococcales bacterium]
MTSRTLDDALPRASLKVYEVFRQEADGAPMVHAGQIEAPGDDLAPDYAREGYARRGESVRLWVIPRDAIIEVTDADLLNPPLDRSYRSGKAYRVAVEKRRAIREKLGTLKGGPEAAPESEEEHKL